MSFALAAMVIGGEVAAEGPSDESLVAAAQRGDAHAFASLHKRYYPRIYRLAYLKTDNAADAEDVAGETFLRALTHLPQFHFSSLPSGRRTLYPWLHRIALNLITDGGRKRAPGGVISLDAETTRGLCALLASEAPDALPHKVAERHEVQQMVRDAIAALPTDQGEVLIYRYLGDLSLREIGSMMGRTESAAKSLLHRAVVALRADLSRRLEPGDPRDIARHYQGEETSYAGNNIAGRRVDA